MRIIARTDTKAVHFLYHAGLAAIENVNNIDERRSKIDRRSFLLSFSVARLAIVNTISCNFYPRSSIVKRVYDCHLPGMFIILHQLCALLDVVPFSNYEKTTPAKRTITATAGIQNDKYGVWVHK